MTVTGASAVEECLQQISERNVDLHAFVALNADRALRDAENGARSAASVAGIPIAVKDIFDVEGFATRANSRSTPDLPADHDAAVVHSLRRQGAVFLGKVQTFELAVGIPSADDLFAPAVNPWDPRRAPGGSSSGAAVAVAARMCWGAVASDSAGSIRGPAAYCGVVGFKPTQGVVPLDGMLQLAPTLDHVGFLTRDVDVLVSLWAPWRKGSGTAEVPRVGVPAELIASAAVEPAVLAGFERTLDTMRSMGWETQHVSLPESGRVRVATRTILARECYQLHAARLDAVGRGARERIEEGALIDDAVYRAALGEANAIRGDLQHVLDGVDVVATPTYPTVSPPYSAPGARGPSPFCIPFNLSGQPSLSVPAGRDPEGMPFGVLLSAASGRDDDLIAWAGRLELALRPAS